MKQHLVALISLIGGIVAGISANKTAGQWIWKIAALPFKTAYRRFARYDGRLEREIKEDFQAGAQKLRCDVDHESSRQSSRRGRAASIKSKVIKDYFFEDKTISISDEVLQNLQSNLPKFVA